MKKYRLGLYEKAVPANLTLKEKIILAKKYNYDFIELSIDETDEKLARLEWTDNEINAIKRLLEEEKFFIQSFCLSGHRRFPLGSESEEIQKKSLEIMEKAIILAHKLGVRYIQIAGYDEYYNESNEKTKANFIKNLKKSVDIAATYGVILAFETMETNFLNTCAKAKYYIDLINSPYLKIYPDIANITNAFNGSSERTINDLKTHANEIVAAHLKEGLPNQYRNLLFGDGYVDFDNIIKTLIENNIYLFVAEFWYLENADWEINLEKTNKFLREKIEEVFS